MHYLSRTVPAFARSALGPCLREGPLSEVLPELCSPLCQLFGAKETLLILHRGTLEEGEEKLITAAFSSGPESEQTEIARLPELWRRAGLDSRISADFAGRHSLSCLSFSSFSWPYPKLSDETLGCFPREYSILLPLSSELLTQHEGECGFSGYFAFFYDKFPQLSENLQQLISNFPLVLSEVIASYSRQDLFLGRELLADFAHDVKRQLLLTEEYIYRLSQKLSGTTESELLQKINKNILRLLQHTSRELLANRAQQNNLSLRPIPTDLNELLKETVQNLAPLLEQNKTSLRLELDSDLPLLNLDPAIFPAVIENLIENAIKYSPQAACILLRSRRSEAKKVSVEVLDKGLGIAEEDRANIFRKYYRGLNSEPISGNGLGLYLVKKIVEAHRGQVYPLPTEEMSTCFKIDLPLESESKTLKKLRDC